MPCPFSVAGEASQSRPRRYTAQQVQLMQQDLRLLLPVMAWVQSFLAQMHQELGRAGKVCPFVPEALRRDSLQFFVVPPLEPGGHVEHTAESIAHSVLEFRERFLELKRAGAGRDMFRAFLLLFPGVDQDRAPALIDGVQRRLKPRFVEAGLMLGEFHPLNEAPGLWNPDFRPLRSPVPLLAMRHMVESDLVFLDRKEDPPATRARFLHAYLRHLRTSLSPAGLERAERALHAAGQEAGMCEQTA